MMEPRVVVARLTEAIETQTAVHRRRFNSEKNEAIKAIISDTIAQQVELTSIVNSPSFLKFLSEVKK